MLSISIVKSSLTVAMVVICLNHCAVDFSI